LHNQHFLDATVLLVDRSLYRTAKLSAAAEALETGGSAFGLQEKRREYRAFF
jgi:hypothetical protein